MSSGPVPNPLPAGCSDPAPDDAALRRSLRDVVALTALSAVWTGKDPAAIATSLVNVLRTNLDLEIAAARVIGQDAPFVSKATRNHDGEWDELAADLLRGEGQAPRAPHSGGLNLLTAPLGYYGEYGRVVAGSPDPNFPTQLQRLCVNVAVNQAAMALQSYMLVTREQDTRQKIERLIELGRIISAEFRRDKLLQAITDAATELSRAQFGSFFYNVNDERGKSYMLYTLSGVPRESFANFPMPRATDMFGPTFRGEGVIRCRDVREDPRYGKNHPHYGMPKGHLPVVSYLAVPVVSRSGEVLGGLFFGHSEAGVFTQPDEDVVVSLAAQAAIAIENQRLFEAAEQSRRELQESHEQISNILESVKNGFFAVDREWRYTFVNERGAQIAQRPRPELIGQSFWDAFSKDGKLAAELRNAMEAREPAHVEDYDAARDAWLQVDAYPTRDGLTILMADVTERKHFDDQLRQTQKLESLGVLAGGVAHDFNNLLTGILGNASLVKDDLPPGSPHHRLLTDVVEASERAARLTAQMLAYAGKGRFVLEPIDISMTVKSISKLIQSSIPKNARIELDLDPDLPPLVGDTAQMQQLIMNLVVNGAEAIPVERTGTVVVSTRRQYADANALRQGFTHGEIAPGEYVCLEVRDDGMGMDEKTLARIFDPFFTTKFMGRGLGLAAALGIVLGHRGALHVRSAPGRGTVFQILLPGSAAVKTRSMEPMPLPDCAVLGDARVLVIDDEDVVRNTAQSALRRSGCDVLTANDGRSGVELFRRRAGEISLVLLDLTMPDMNGEEALGRLQSIRADVKVLLSSGYSESEIMARFAGKRLAGFLQKPYGAAVLVQKVRKALERTTAGQ